jgi:adenine/guanine phosphoribosyltransferase-like PRPP-binding protein
MNPLPPYSVRLHPAGHAVGAPASYDTHYPVRLLDGTTLELPLRDLPGGGQAIALLMSNQTPFLVEDALAPLLTRAARDLMPDVIAAVPTMGLDYARLVARGLGHQDYVALGLSRKFWYDEALSERVSSSTSPEHAKSVYLDPALLSRVAGRRVVLVDDVINTGASALAAIRLLLRAGARVAGLVVVLTEGHAWREALSVLGPPWDGRVHAVGHIPLFDRGADGRWVPHPGTD